MIASAPLLPRWLKTPYHSALVSLRLESGHLSHNKCGADTALSTPCYRRGVDSQQNAGATMRDRICFIETLLRPNRGFSQESGAGFMTQPSLRRLTAEVLALPQLVRVQVV